MIDSFLVFHAQPVPGVGRDPAGSEVLCQETSGMPQNNQRIRRRIAIASRPEGIDAADDGRKSVLWAEKVDGTGLAVISGEDSDMCALIRGKSVAHLSNGFDQLRPADFFDKITLNVAGDVPPFRMARGERQG